MLGVGTKTLISGYSRLKNVFRSGINSSCYGEIVSTAKNKVVGNLPKDILASIISGGGNKREMIISTQKAYEKAATILSKTGIARKEYIMRIPSGDRGVNYIISKIAKMFSNNSLAPLFEGDKLYSEKITEITIKAEEVLLRKFKQIIPETQNVIITPIGEGSFGMAYKVSVFGEKGKPIFADKVLKVYKAGTSFDENNATLMTKVAQLIKTSSNKALASCVKEFGASDMRIKDVRRGKKKLLKYMSADNQELKDIFGLSSATEHGAAAEANSAEYIRFASGHKLTSKDGIILPDMYSLGDTKFAISEFVDRTKGAENEFNFNRLGMVYMDDKRSNKINGIIVDLGGIINKAETPKSRTKAMIKAIKETA